MSNNLFFSVELSTSVQDELDKFVADIHGRFDSPIIWTGSGKWHITLGFLGKHSTQLERSARAALEALQNVPDHLHISPFELAVEGLGTLPGAARPRVLWAGVKDPDHTLTALRRWLCDYVSVAGAHGSFTPHVTIGKVGTGVESEFTHVVNDYPEFSAGTSIVTAVKLILTENGAYRALSWCTL